jgi:hypothetical protein
LRQQRCGFFHKLDAKMWRIQANLGKNEAEKWQKLVNPLASSHYRHYSAPQKPPIRMASRMTPMGHVTSTRCLRNFYMRKFVLAAAAAGAALSLVACSEAAPEADVDTAMADAEANVEAAADDAVEAVEAVEVAADDAAATAEEAMTEEAPAE